MSADAALQLIDGEMQALKTEGKRDQERSRQLEDCKKALNRETLAKNQRIGEILLRYHVGRTAVVEEKGAEQDIEETKSMEEEETLSDVNKDQVEEEKKVKGMVGKKKKIFEFTTKQYDSGNLSALWIACPYREPLKLFDGIYGAAHSSKSMNKVLSRHHGVEIRLLDWHDEEWHKKHSLYLYKK